MHIEPCRHFDEATRYCRRALDISQPVPSAHRVHGDLSMLLANALWQSGNLDGALKTVNEAVELEEKQAAGGHASIRVNLASSLWLKGMIQGKQDTEASLGLTHEALATFQRALEIVEDLAKKDPVDYLGPHNVALFGLQIGNILRYSDLPQALEVYDHALARMREAKTNISTERDEAELLESSSYAMRWSGRNAEAKQRIEKAFELLRDAKRYPADKIEPMSDTYDALRASADDYVETGQAMKAVEVYQQLLDKLMAWKPDVQTIFVTRLVFRVLGRLLQTFFGGSDGLTKPSGLKHKGQNFGAIG